MDFRVFAFWTGDNPLPENRLNCLKSMENIGIPIDLVFKHDVNGFVNKIGTPLHKNFEHLSLTHKADYLRVYFMHFFGGGYADIKHYDKSWVNIFKKLNTSEDKYIAGYQEVSKNAVAQIGGRGQQELEKHFRLLAGNGAYICKPQTEFTKEWFDRTNKVLDRKDFSGEYPLQWTELLGNVFHPLCLNYFQHIILDDSIKPNFNKPYR